MDVRTESSLPGHDGWNSKHAEYYKQYSALIGDPQLRARTEEKMQAIVRNAEHKMNVQEEARRQEVIRAQEVSRRN
ncbi:uncharacterized protein RSE6_05647 [Rhynchosporium secalis]|uniref:Uncharacterized protein n=1 Tax=Rhynchosporium secalis TaxID=38038 RepID=A0A1E1M8D6_RHYSE|nr:uncharacterized protein RSE6_05647 [Rhynchosporium secalis]